MQRPVSMLITSLALLLCALSAPTAAAPITGGTGPGGVGLADGSSNLQAWFKADTLSQFDGSPVGTWTDSSGNGLDASEATNQPSFQSGVQNGLPVVRFDNSNAERLETADSGAYSGDQAHTVISAFSVDTFGTSAHHNPLFGIGSNPGTNARHNVHLAFENATTTTDRLEGGAVSYSTSMGSTFRTLANRYTGGGISNYSLHVDGTLQSSSGGGTTTHDFLTGEIRIADQSNSGQQSLPNFDGDIGEIAFFNRALNDAELIIVDNYLAAKYNKTASGSGTINNDFYAGDLAVNGNHDVDVFGIGQLSGSGISNSGAAGFGFEATGSGSSALDNGEFLLAGHDTGAIGITADCCWSAVLDCISAVAGRDGNRPATAMKKPSGPMATSHAVVRRSSRYTKER